MVKRKEKKDIGRQVILRNKINMIARAERLMKLTTAEKQNMIDYYHTLGQLARMTKKNDLTRTGRLKKVRGKSLSSFALSLLDNSGDIKATRRSRKNAKKAQKQKSKNK